ncbi:MAG TPA: hypothetical protein VFL12_02405 [Thermoanaerobaculia bacterium]|nr:hypothetical protein [Thermoanaerobaculia bacterium]
MGLAGQLARRWIAASIAAFLVLPTAIAAEGPPSVAVRHTEGVVHGFLSLSAADGRVLADGDSTQFSRGDRVTNRLAFRFRDGSYQEETAVFRQGRTFELLSDHLIQRGPSFPHPVDASIDRGAGRVSVTVPDKTGKPRTIEKRIDFPSGLANGLVATLLKNVAPDGREMTLDYLATSPSPLLVQLDVFREGEDSMTVGRQKYRLARFVVRVRIPGIRGVAAKLLGKQPGDTRVWILEGEAPTFVRSEGPAYPGGPPWVIQLVGPGAPGSSR